MPGDPAPTRMVDGRAADTQTLRGALRLFFRFPAPVLLAAQIAVCLPIRLYLGDFGLSDVVIAGIVLVLWPMQEWFLHWKVLHFRPTTVLGFRLDPLPSRRHRQHHRQPWVLASTFLPALFIAGAIPVHIGVWWLVCDDWPRALTGVVLFGSAALIYEWVHYLTHTAYRPVSAYYRKIWRNHRMHHFKNERYWYSFTAPFIDGWFGTGPDPASVEKSETVRSLGVED